MFDQLSESLSGKIAELFRKSFPEAKQLHVAGILSYTTDNSSEKFLKIKLDVPEAENDLDSKIIPDEETFPKTDIANVICSGNMCSAISDVKFENFHDSRRDRRKCRKPQRQPIPFQQNSCFPGEVVDVEKLKRGFEDHSFLTETRVSANTNENELQKHDTSPIRNNDADFITENSADHAEICDSNVAAYVPFIDEVRISSVPSETEDFTVQSTVRISPVCTPQIAFSTMRNDTDVSPSRDTNILNKINNVITTHMTQEQTVGSHQLGLVESDKILDTLNLLRFVNSQAGVNPVFAATQGIQANNLSLASMNLVPAAHAWGSQSVEIKQAATNAIKQPGLTSISMCPTLALIGTIEPCITSVGNEPISYSVVAKSDPQVSSNLRQNQCITLNTTDFINTAAVASTLLRNLAAAKHQQTAQNDVPQNVCNITDEMSTRIDEKKLESTQLKRSTTEGISIAEVTQCSPTFSMSIGSTNLENSGSSIATTIMNRCLNNSLTRGPILVSYSRAKSGSNVAIAPAHDISLFQVPLSNPCNSSIPVCKRLDVIRPISNSVTGTVTIPASTVTSIEHERNLKRKLSKTSSKLGDESESKAGETASAIDKILKTIKVCMSNSETQVADAKSIRISMSCPSGAKPETTQTGGIQLCQIPDKNILVPIKMTTIPTKIQRSEMSEISNEPSMNVERPAHEGNRTCRDDDGLQGSRRTYRCHYCGKLFNRKFCRERHERLHTGIKPYTCEVCNEKFIRLEDKKRHVRSLQHYSTDRVSYRNTDLPTCTTLTTTQLESKNILSPELYSQSTDEVPMEDQDDGSDAVSGENTDPDLNSTAINSSMEIVHDGSDITGQPNLDDKLRTTDGRSGITGSADNTPMAKTRFWTLLGTLKEKKAGVAIMKSSKSGHEDAIIT